MLIKLILFVFLIENAFCSSKYVESKWSNFEFAIKNRFNSIFGKELTDDLRSFLNQSKFENEISTKCRASLVELVEDLRDMKFWAVKMFDASAKIPASGLLEGTVTDLGQYDECLSIKVPSNYTGQYCTLRITPVLPDRPLFNTINDKIPQLSEIIKNADGKHDKWLAYLAGNAQFFYFTPIRLGICVPSACSSNELNQLISYWFEKNFSLKAIIAEDGCETEEQVELTKKFGSAQFISIAFISSFCLLVLLGSLTDAFDLNVIYSSFMIAIKRLIKQFNLNEEQPDDQKETQNQIMKSHSMLFTWLNCFSIQRNLPVLVNVNHSSNDKSSSSIDVMHGIKVFAMCWVILGHTYGLINAENHEKIFVSTKIYSELFSQPFLNATLSVNTFFAMSGLLTSFTLLMSCDKMKKNFLFYIMAIFLRLFRLLPSYLALICITMLFGQFRSGPLWTETVQKPVIENCQVSFWTNLIFLNNFIKTQQMCLMHTWYLSIDMQFYVFGLLIFYVFSRNKKVSFLIMLASCLIATIYSVTVSYINNYPPTILATAPAVTERWNFILDFYYKPWHHLTSWSLGFYFGYALYLVQTGAEKSWLYKLYSNAILRSVMNLSMASLGIFTIFSIFFWNAGFKIPQLITAIYASTFRISWSLSILWLIFVCTIEREGLTYRFLTWPGWLPISRLTYSAFLFHPLIIWIHFGTLEHRLSYNHLEFIRMFSSNVILSLILALITSLIFESPIVNLQKLIFKNLKNSSNESRKKDHSTLHEQNEPIKCTKF